MWQLETRLANGDRWKESPYVFTGECGGHLAPDSVSGYLSRFEKKYSLPHIHAHKFRYSMASVLYFSGADPVSISKRLGHAQVSTTVSIKNRNTNTLNRQSHLILKTNRVFRKKVEHSICFDAYYLSYAMHL